jgi:hypothetical protein
VRERERERERKTTEKYYCIYFLYLWGSNVEYGEKESNNNNEKTRKEC